MSSSVVLYEDQADMMQTDLFRGKINKDSRMIFYKCQRDWFQEIY